MSRNDDKKTISQQLLPNDIPHLIPADVFGRIQEFISNWSELQKAQTLQQQIRILFINAVANGCPEAVLEDFVASVVQEEQDEIDKTFSDACANAYKAAFEEVTEKQKPSPAGAVDSSEMLPDYDSAIRIFSDSTKGTKKDLLRALKSIQRTVPTLTREQARELLILPLPQGEERSEKIIFDKLLYVDLDDRYFKFERSSTKADMQHIMDSAREILIALIPYLDAEQIKEWFNTIESEKNRFIPQDGRIRLTIFKVIATLIPYLTDEQKRQAQTWLNVFLQLVPEKDRGEIMMQAITRFLAYSSNPYEVLQLFDENSKMRELLQKTLPYFVPHIPAQFLSKNKHLSGKVKKEKN